MSLLLEWWPWLCASPTPPPLPPGNELNAEVCTVIWFPSGCALKEQVCVERNCFVGFLFIQVLPPAWITWVDSIKARMDAVHWRGFLEHVPFLQWCIINQLQASQQAKVAFKDAVKSFFFSPHLVPVRRICRSHLICSESSVTTYISTVAPLNHSLFWLQSPCLRDNRHTMEKCKGLMSTCTDLCSSQPPLTSFFLPPPAPNLGVLCALAL